MVPAPRAHPSCYRLRGRQRAANINCEVRVKGVARLVGQGGVAQRGRVVMQHFNRPKDLLDLPNERGDAGILAGVERARLGVVALGAQPRGELLGFSGVTRGQYHAKPFVSKPLGGSQAIARAGPNTQQCLHKSRALNSNTKFSLCARLPP
jgi:hypothetical protein